jgi:hypothetical protein
LHAVGHRRGASAPAPASFPGAPPTGLKCRGGPPCQRSGQSRALPPTRMRTRVRRFGSCKHCTACPCDPHLHRPWRVLLKCGTAVVGTRHAHHVWLVILLQPPWYTHASQRAVSRSLCRSVTRSLSLSLSLTHTHTHTHTHTRARAFCLSCALSLASLSLSLYPARARALSLC